MIDDIALEITMIAPDNAKSFAFDFDFFTFEWPDYVCSPFNDFFAAILSPAPENVPDGNISFDSVGHPVNVNNVLVRVCECETGPPCVAPPGEPLKEFACELGSAELDKTGFEGHAATSWLTTKAPVVGGDSITLRWGIYDAGDHVLDSTVVIDNFRWLSTPEDGPSTTPFDPK